MVRNLNIRSKGAKISANKRRQRLSRLAARRGERAQSRALARQLAILRAAARALGLPAQGLLRGRLSDALTDTRRALRLEAAGYEVVALELVPAAVTPQNLLLRARFVGATTRAERARSALDRLRAPAA